MKEAAGEANMTVITIVLVGIVLAIATPIITSVVNNSKKSACCQSNGGVWFSGACYIASSCATNNASKITQCTQTLANGTVCD